MREVIVQRLNRALGLDPAQLEQVRSIVKETHAEMKNARRKIRPEMDDIMARSQDRIRSILRPDQLAKYEKIVEGRKKKREDEETTDRSKEVVSLYSLSPR